MKNNKLKKVLTWAAALTGVGVLAQTGHHFGLYNLSPIYNFIGLKASEFGWATASYTGLFIVSKVMAGVASDLVANRNEQFAYQTQLKIESEKITQEKLDRNYEIEKQNQAYMKALIEADLASKEYISDLHIVKDTPLAEIAHSLKEKYEHELKVIGTDAVDDTLNVGSKLLDRVVDKGTNFVADKIDDVIEKL